MKKYTRDAIYHELDSEDISAKKGDFIEITEWKNGEGFDVSVSHTSLPEQFSITYDSWNLLKKMIKKLNK